MGKITNFNEGEDSDEDGETDPNDEPVFAKNEYVYLPQKNCYGLI